MKASELRIGNYYDNNGVVSTVNPNTIEELWFVERSWVKPIPLTEEWLLKFGFELSIDFFSPDYLWGKVESGNPRRAVGVYNPDEQEDWFMMFREDVGCDWVELNELQYVHQLQNLYFALTGEELTTHNE